MGIMTKTDKIDVYMLACYALLKKTHRQESPLPEVRHLCALLRLLADISVIQAGAPSHDRLLFSHQKAKAIPVRRATFEKNA